MKKRFVSIFLLIATMITLFASIQVGAATVTNDQFISKLSALRNTYRHGEYWNYYNSSNYSQTGKTPCPICTKNKRSFCHWECNDACGQFGGGGQCEGYAMKMAYLVFGDYDRLRQNYANWEKRVVKISDSSVGNIYAGDIIRLDSLSSGHSIFVTKVTDSHIYYTQCNVGGNCKVTWDNQMSKSTLKKRWFMIRHRKGNACTGGNAIVNKPSAPLSVNISSTETAVGGSITANWGAVSGATSYDVSLNCTTNSSYNQKKGVTGTSATFIVNNAGTYTISVSAKNTAGSSSATTSSGIIAKADVKVTFKDYDGTILGTQTIKWNGTAKAPSAPSREGYTFQGWDKALSNIKTDTSITATYEINTYTVKFIDNEGNTLSTQRITYGNSAIEPQGVSAPPGYVFVGWDKDAYKFVKEDLTITAVFSWENTDLPIIASFISATRNFDASGYDLKLNLKNYPDSATKGKIIATLKTEAGKMVASATQTFSLAANGTKEEELYIDYSGVATVAEISVVGIIDDGNTGVPLAGTIKQAIDLGLQWSDWSEDTPPTGDYIIESRTEYRYRDKETTASKVNTMAGWTLYDSQTTSWGGWSGWSRTPVTASETRQVETQNVAATYQTRYTYNRSVNNAGTLSSYSSSYYPNYQSIDLSYALTSKGTSNGRTRYGSYAGAYGTYLQNWWWNQGTYQKQLTSAYTQYRYRDALYTYYFYKWNDWSDWAAEIISASDSRQVEQRTVYRFKSNDIKLTAYNYKRYKYQNLNTGDYYYTYSSVYADSVGYPGEWEYKKTYAELPEITTVDDSITLYNGYGEDSWYSVEATMGGDAAEYITYDTLEDTSGKIYTVSGSINAANKIATLMVFKGTNSDPTASQLEYVEQVTLGENGEYLFNINPKEIPSFHTGDFIIMLGIEGGTAPIYIDIIEAPKQNYTVNFVDDNGTVIESQIVSEGDSATLPENNPEKAGHYFTGWDTGVTNIRSDLTITAQYKKKEYTVVFVDWEENDVDILTFEHGDVLEGPEAVEKEGSTFVGWDAILNGTTLVTENMIVSAVYEVNTYTIRFADNSGNIISTKTAEYGDEVPIPEEEPSIENLVFAGWSNVQLLIFASEDTTVYPIYEYAETVADPVASVTAGTYQTSQEVSLTCETTSAKIYYAFLNDADVFYQDNLSEDEIEWIEYSDPIIISSSTALVFYAHVEGMNHSAYHLEEYTLLSDLHVEIIGSTLTKSSGTISGKVYYKIAGEGTSASAIPIISIYDGLGQMVYFKIGEEAVWNAGENFSDFSEISFQQTKGNYTVKIFLWKAMGNLTPLSTAGILKYE